MLHFIKGSSGTGKSRYITELLKSYADKGEDKLLFIVPDQSSFETEKTFLDLMGASESLKIKVLGFSRICDHIREINGSSGKKPLDDGGKAILMNLALEECRDNMPLFSNTKNKRELSRLMLKAVKEYKTCNITPQMLQKAEESIESESLVQKLKETSLVKEVFEALVSESYVDPDDYLTLALDSIKENNIFVDHIIAMDSFSGFTKQELDFIEKLIADSKEFYISLLTDNTGDKELFFTTERTCSQLRAIAENNSVKTAPDIILDKPYRFKNTELISLFNYAFRTVKKPYEKEVNGITLYHSANIHTECDFVARNIRKLVVEEGYMYNDIVVICRDDEQYSGIIDTAFEKYQIPYFMDRVEDIHTKPIVRFITYALETVNNSFRRESVLNMLKSGVTSYTPEQIAEFENYIYSWNISGTKFYKPFVDNPAGYAAKEEADLEQLERINAIRTDVIEPLKKFRDDCKGKTAEEITKKLYDLLLCFKIPDNIIELCLESEENGDFRQSDENRRLWDILMKILDKMIDLLSDKRISLKEYSELLLIQFNSAEIGYIPGTVDEVVVSGIERVRLNKKKAVFLVGCNEGEFPAATSTGGIFTDKERKLLIKHGIEINDSAEDLTFKEIYLAFYALTLAEEKLFVSYNIGDLSGGEKAPSEIVGELTEIFPELHETGDEEKTTEDNLWCKKSAFRYMAERSNTDSITENALKNYFLNDEEYRTRAKAVTDRDESKQIKIESPHIAGELYGKNIRLSASKAEQFSNCKFSFFMKYGISAKERQKNEVNALNYGTLMHYVMEKFFSKNKKADFINFSEKEINDKISAYFSAFLEEYLGGAQGKEKGFLYQYNKMQRNARKIVNYIIESFKYSKFEPADFELGIGRDLPPYSLDSGNGTTINVEGSIDRVDMFRQDGKLYVRIVDYKTGTKEFKLSDILYGKNLQMLIYLAALIRYGKQYYGSEITPTGILYQPASAKCTSKKDVYSALKNKGLLLNDTKIISYMDDEAPCRFISFKANKDGSPDSASAENLCTEEEFNELFKSIDKTLTEMAASLHRGEIDCDPISDSGTVYCQYCPYRQICGKDDTENVREKVDLKHKEVFKILKEREENAKVD